ncbi:MAG: FTR1 family protein [Patescibacteria group bacterium]|jgi:FTR1 family protein
MLANALVSFREFLEAFLIIGVFLGISKKLKLKRDFEIYLASGIGILLSLLLATLTYYFSNYAQIVFSEKNREILESLLLIFSGVFIIYTTISLHNLLHKIQEKTAAKAHQKLHSNLFDISLFFTIMFLVIREGFEIALFTASTSLLSIFIQNFIGLIIGFILASTFGILTFFAYLKFPITKVLKVTKYTIILLGTMMIVDGMIKLFFNSYFLKF